MQGIKPSAKALESSPAQIRSDRGQQEWINMFEAGSVSGDVRR
jgi:hypothetical protein